MGKCLHSLQTMGKCLHSLQTMGKCLHSLQTMGKCLHSLQTMGKCLHTLQTMGKCLHSLQTMGKYGRRVQCFQRSLNDRPTLNKCTTLTQTILYDSAQTSQHKNTTLDEPDQRALGAEVIISSKSIFCFTKLLNFQQLVYMPYRLHKNSPDLFPFTLQIRDE